MEIRVVFTLVGGKLRGGVNKKLGHPAPLSISLLPLGHSTLKPTPMTLSLGPVSSLLITAYSLSILFIRIYLSVLHYYHPHITLTRLL